MNGKGISQHAEQIRPHYLVSKQFLKVLPPYKVTVKQRFSRLILEKRKGPAPQRQIIKQQYHKDSRQSHKKNLIAQPFF